MFEYDQEIVKNLLDQNKEFKVLYMEHNTLKSKVRDAEIGVLPMDDQTLCTMKRQKLNHKDKMASMIERYREDEVN